MREADRWWGEDVWSWTPEEGRWSEKQHSSPKEAVHIRLDTENLRPHERYDFWRDIALYDVDADRRVAVPPFSAQAAGIISAEGSVFINKADALSGKRRRGQSDRDGCEDVAIGLVLGGKRGLEEGDERSQSVAGQFLVYDARRESRLAWSSYQTVHLVMRRPLVEAALGEVGSSRDLARRLEAAPTGRILAAHLRALGGDLDKLGPGERAGMLGITLDLAQLALRDVAGRSWDHEEAAVASGVFAAALRLIDANLANPELGPQMLAKLLGCSRATLYRCFAEQDMPIAVAIRKRRLLWAREMLRSAPAHVSIGEIAVRCGYHDPAYFSRAFRQEYGFSPRDARV